MHSTCIQKGADIPKDILISISLPINFQYQFSLCLKKRRSQLAFISSVLPFKKVSEGPPSRGHVPVSCMFHQTFEFLQLTSLSIRLSILFLIEWTCVGVLNRSSRSSYHIYWLQTNRRTGFLRSEYIIVKYTCKTWIRYTLQSLNLGQIWQSSE